MYHKFRFLDINGRAYPSWKNLATPSLLVEEKGAMKIGPFGSALKKDCFVTEGKKVFAQENVFKNDFSIGSQYVTDEKYNELIGCKLEPGDIVISTMGTVGACAIFPQNAEDGIMNSHLLRLRVNSDTVVPEYLVQSIRNADYIKKQIDKLSVGSIMTGLSSSIVQKLVFKIPSLPEQQKIADFLSAYDEKISIQRQKVEALERRKKGLLQKVFSQELRFKNENGNDFPKWELRKVSDIGTVVGGGTPKTSNKSFWNGKTPWISSSDLVDDSIHYISMTRFITDEAIEHSATKVIPENSILVVTRVGVGKVALSECDVCTSQDFANITDCKGDVTYLAYAIKCVVEKESRRDTRGTSVKGITSAALKDYKIPFPSLVEQQKIDEQISIEKERLATMERVKKGLLQGLFC